MAGLRVEAPQAMSVVIEMETAELAVEKRVGANIDEVVRQAEGLPCAAEVLVVSGKRWDGAPRRVRVVVAEGESYYALKNTGAAHATGDLVVFLDADCRIASGYLRVVFERFARDASLECLAGRTRYAGDTVASRINTALSFGYLWRERAGERGYAVLSHNVAVRRSTLGGPPFGPFRGRVRGDLYLTNYYRARHAPPVIVDELLVEHEDCSFSLRLLLERHLREHLKHVEDVKELGLTTPAGRTALRSVRRSIGARWRKLRAYGRDVGVGRGGMCLAGALLPFYFVCDLLAVTATLSFRAVGRRWLGYQNGVLPSDAEVVA
jgi:glycosyltransferase involved in cell wall biosynthesis